MTTAKMPKNMLFCHIWPKFKAIFFQIFCKVVSNHLYQLCSCMGNRIFLKKSQKNFGELMLKRKKIISLPLPQKHPHLAHFFTHVFYGQKYFFFVVTTFFFHFSRLWKLFGHLLLQFLFSHNFLKNFCSKTDVSSSVRFFFKSSALNLFFFS